MTSNKKQYFGGSGTTPKEARKLAYSYRVARRQNRLFWWKVATGIRGYATSADRLRGIAELRAQGFNHFTTFRDVRAYYAVQFGTRAK